MAPTQQLQLLAPLSGLLMPLEQVPDPVFCSRVIGDGLCIDPTSQTLRAPLAGVVSNVQDSGHAVSITDDNGVQVLMHIGLDTVNLAGKGFSRLVEEGQRVEAGQPLIEFDADYIAVHARSLLTLMLVVSGEPFTWLTGDSALVDSGQPLLQLSLGAPAPSAEPEEEGEARFSKPVTLPNPNGLHARPAAVFAQAAKASRRASACTSSRPAPTPSPWWRSWHCRPRRAMPCKSARRVRMPRGRSRPWPNCWRVVVARR